jgi:glutamate 5-kinase
MATKVQAARIATQAGKAMAILDGRGKGSLLALMAGKDIGTLFLPAAKGGASAGGRHAR